MGQGVRTTLPLLLADELEVDLSKVTLVQAIPGPRFKNIRLRTSGSGSSTRSWDLLRTAGASAREVLIAAAAQAWAIDAKRCVARNGAVFDPQTGRSLTYGALVERAANLPVPEKPQLKSASEFRYIGKNVNRLDGPDLVHGRARFGQDVRVPGMLFAVMARCPYMHSKFRKYDAAEAMKIPGVRAIVPIHSGYASGIAVVADNTWTALQGRDALHVEWEPGKHAAFSSETFSQQLHAALDDEGFFVRSEGDARAAFTAAETFERTYEYPFQAHAPLETMNCTASVRAGKCDLWVPTQAPNSCQQDVATLLGIPVDDVTVNVILIGGGFGRRLGTDYAVEAAELSKAVDAPVQLLWSREDDMRCGYFQPNSCDRIKVALDTQRKPIAWTHTTAGSDLTFVPSDPKELANKNRYADDGSPWGNFDNPYRFANVHMNYIPVESPVWTGPWRAVEYPGTVFARESFLDELAHELKRDPLDLRLELLEPGDVLTLGEQKIARARLQNVLRTAAQRSGWSSPMPSDAEYLRGRGIACNVYDAESYIAQVAEVAISRATNELRVERIFCVVDCGQVINLSGLAGQAESAILWGLSATIGGPITFRDGQVQQSSFGDYRVAAMSDSPDIDFRAIASQAHPGGFGEHGVPPVAPAVANAVFMATGRRFRKLPITLA
jgi:isoquinoline 1-oxidoreductase beta subunit